MEVVNGASRTGLSVHDFLVALKEAGVDSLPGTAAEILDDDVRWVLTKGKLPTAAWIDVVTTAHRVGLPTTSTMMYGHVDTPAHWAAHLLLLRRLQEESGGFTEFVPLPFVHTSAPLYLAGVARPGPTAATTARCTPSPGWCCTARSTTCSAPGSSSGPSCAARCSTAGSTTSAAR
jgi:FO synthase